MRQTFALLAIVALAATLNVQTAPPGGAKAHGRSTGGRAV